MRLVKSLGTLVKAVKAYFLPLFDELSSYLMLMLGMDKTTEEKRIAICIFDDVAEQCHEAAISDWLAMVRWKVSSISVDGSLTANGGYRMCTDVAQLFSIIFCVEAGFKAVLF